MNLFRNDTVLMNVFEDASGETPASQLARFNVETQLMSMFHSVHS